MEEQLHQVGDDGLLPEHDGLPELPHESWFRIFSFLSPSNSLHVCLTCKLWNELWQDKALWKHFHQSLLGGKPRPPLLPNAWKKSFKESFVCLRTAHSPSRRLELAIQNGRTVFVQKMLQIDPQVFDLPNLGYYHFWEGIYSNHPLVFATSSEENLPMFQLLWFICFPDSSTKQPPKLQGEDAAKVVKACATSMAKLGRAAMMRFLFTVGTPLFPSLLEYVRDSGHWQKEKASHNVEYLTLMEEIGAPLTQRILIMNLNDSTRAHWLLDRVKGWQSMTDPNVLHAALTPAKVWLSGIAQRSVVKMLLKEGASTYDWGQLLEDYASGAIVDKKILKWLLKKHEAALGRKEENLAFYVEAIEKGDIKILQYLIKIGATDVNHVHPDWGKTLLQIAVERGRKAMVKNLLACGADPKAKGKKAAAPLSLANQLGNKEVRDMLVEACEEREGRGKRKRQEGEEVKAAGDSKKSVEKEQGAKEARKRRKTEASVEDPDAEEKKLQARVAELHQWISDRDGVANLLLVPVKQATAAGFSYGKVRVACSQLKLRTRSLKKLALLQALVQFLEDKQAVVAHEL